METPEDYVNLAKIEPKDLTDAQVIAVVSRFDNATMFSDFSLHSPISFVLREASKRGLKILDSFEELQKEQTNEQ